MGVMNEDRLTLYDGLIKTHITNTTVAKETGKGLSTNDYTTDEKTKLAGIAEGANKTIVDSALDASSENAVQNKVVKEQIDALTTQINNAIALRSSLEQYGMAKLSDSAAVTDSTGLALPATEKNATIEGTLANQIAQLNTDLLTVGGTDFSETLHTFSKGETYTTTTCGVLFGSFWLDNGEANMTIDGVDISTLYNAVNNVIDKPVPVCIPIGKGSTVVTGSSGSYPILYAAK